MQVPTHVKVKCKMLKTAPMITGTVSDLNFPLFFLCPRKCAASILLPLSVADVHEKEMRGNKLNDDGQYSYPFTPDKQSQFLDHKFAIKAFSLDNGWGDYSDYTVAQPCEWGN